MFCVQNILYLGGMYHRALVGMDLLCGLVLWVGWEIESL